MPRTSFAIALAAVMLATGMALGQSGPPLTPETYPARGPARQPVPRVVERVPVVIVQPLAYAFGSSPVSPFTAGRVEGAHVFADPPAAERARRIGYGWPRPGSGTRFKESVDAQVKSAADLRGLVILQIGDSHTAIDQFSGELRRRLQAAYGDGGAGYFAAGKPNIGVRASPLKISTTVGWTYQSLQAAADGGGFLLSGFNAIAGGAGESMTFSAETPIAFDRIEIEALREPGGGAIDIRLDGVLESQFALAAGKAEPVVIRLVPERVDRLREITITTRGEGTVKIASVAVYNKSFGLSYNAVGYPGATIDILNKLDSKTFADELTRLSPQIVVLAFGTNEGFNDGLDLERYVQGYERVVQKIRAVLPGTSIVVVSPPNANRLPATCKGEGQKAACRRAGAEPETSPKNGNGACVWQTPPQLDRVREAQRAIAERHRLAWWNWASMMADACGAHEWALMTPPLIARDHVHFTPDGYRKSAGQFMQTLLPIIEKLRAPRDVVSHD
jgi:lysophospholipase L1-like esterase